MRKLINSALFPSHVKWVKHLSLAIRAGVFSLFVLFSTGAFGQTVIQSVLTCTPAQAHCTSGDLSVVNVFVDLPACTPCTNNTISAPLKMTIHNGTKSLRAAFALWGTLSTGASINGVSGNIFVCVGAITVKSGETGIPASAGTGNQTFTVGTIVFNCGQALSLTNNLMAWTDASGTTVDRCNVFATATNCADIEPKCGAVPSITIGQPLGASYTTTQGCTGASLGKIKVTPVGGTGPYTVVLKKNNVTVATKTGVTASGWEFPGLAEGTDYSAAITDASTPTACTYTLTPMTLGSFFCCTAPTQGTNPSNVAKCAGESASFTATATGGDPTPTVQWQEKIGAAAFANIGNGGVFSGVTTTTLNISNVNGLNGNQYRAVFTSSGCTPTNSNPATLTVNPILTASVSIGVAPSNTICAGTSVTFTATPTNGGSTPTYQWKKNGSNITGETGSTYTTSTLVNGDKITVVMTSNATPCLTGSPATSNEITMTVNTAPPAPSTTYHPPACDQTTFSVEVTNVVTGATYLIKKGDGSSLAGVATPSNQIVAASNANITFSGIPAGSGFQVSVSKAGCSPEGAALPCTSSPSSGRITSTTATIEFGGESQTTVKAYPNPFSDKVKFLVTSSVAGKGTLEVYNMMGQNVKTVYQGYIAAGTQTFELSLPNQQVANLVYVLRIGDKKMTGKILQINR